MIETPVQVLRTHKIKSADDLMAFAQRQVAKLRQAGYDVAMHEDATPCLARVDMGRWIIDCACGAGNAVHPDWAFAACPACGAIHRTIAYPNDRDDIERVLDERSHQWQKFWRPGETVETLRAENLAHGIVRRAG
jgi:hypothetical protein